MEIRDVEKLKSGEQTAHFYLASAVIDGTPGAKIGALYLASETPRPLTPPGVEGFRNWIE